MDISKIEIIQCGKKDDNFRGIQNLLELTIDGNVLSFALDNNISYEDIICELKKLDTTTLSVMARPNNIIGEIIYE